MRIAIREEILYLWGSQQRAQKKTWWLCLLFNSNEFVVLDQWKEHRRMIHQWHLLLQQQHREQRLQPQQQQQQHRHLKRWSMFVEIVIVIMNWNPRMLFDVRFIDSFHCLSSWYSRQWMWLSNLVQKTNKTFSWIWRSLIIIIIRIKYFRFFLSIYVLI